MVAPWPVVCWADEEFLEMVGRSGFFIAVVVLSEGEHISSK
jgi:hypothetical protein